MSTTEPGPRPRHRVPLTLAEARAKEERRVRSLQVSTFCLHSMAWILATFYATDYLPPLAIRFTVGVRQTALAQYLVGYLVLGLLCVLLATGFGVLYGPRIKNSRFAWRWFVFPVALALLLIPAQGSNELLTRGVEALCLVAGIAVGESLSRRLRRWLRRPARGRLAAP
ncbi:MAG: hypothetical protein WB801_04440 [Candidatus Dormiibacterota bacterium]